MRKATSWLVYLLSSLLGNRSFHLQYVWPLPMMYWITCSRYVSHILAGSNLSYCNATIAAILQSKEGYPSTNPSYTRPCGSVIISRKRCLIEWLYLAILANHSKSIQLKSSLKGFLYSGTRSSMLGILPNTLQGSLPLRGIFALLPLLLHSLTSFHSVCQYVDIVLIGYKL